MILAVGNSGSYEVKAYSAVVDALQRRGYNALLFKQDKCLNGEYLSFDVCSGIARFIISVDGKEYNVDDFSAIWYMKPYVAKELLTYNPAEYRQFIHRQFLVMRQALWTVFRDKKWLNDPWCLYRAENKIYQLEVATSIGFSVPNTLITSDPNKVNAFYNNNLGQIIVKLLASSPILDQVIYTNKVTSEHLSKIDSVKQSPSIFQAIIPKDYELRITVVGDKIFPVKIYSQEDEKTSLDWRRKPKLNDHEVKMEVVTLPREVESRIHTYMQSLGLRFGCIDMVVTPEGEYVFLEVNPNGQWYFVQLKTEVQIAEAIADLLI